MKPLHERSVAKLQLAQKHLAEVAADEGLRGNYEVALRVFGLCKQVHALAENGELDAEEIRGGGGGEERVQSDRIIGVSTMR